MKEYHFKRENMGKSMDKPLDFTQAPYGS